MNSVRRVQRVQLFLTPPHARVRWDREGAPVAPLAEIALGTALKIRKKCLFAYLTRGRSTLTPRVLPQTLRDRVSRKRPFNGRLTGAQGVVRNRWVAPLTPFPAARGFTDGGLYDW
jgi:hypothetical protein